MAEAILSSTAQAECETIFQARQRIFEAQAIAQVLKQQFIHSANSHPGAMSCMDAIGHLLQEAVDGLEPLE